MVTSNQREDAMKDAADTKTKDMLEKPKTKAQRFREKQIATGLRQYSYWLSEAENEQVKKLISTMRGE